MRWSITLKLSKWCVGLQVDYTIWGPTHRVNRDGFESHARNEDEWIKVVTS